MRISFFTPQRERCGISDYSRHLIAALRGQLEITELRIVTAPADAARGSSMEALRHFSDDTRRFRELGAQMNDVDVAHIQHQYFFFGGVAPHKNHTRAFLDSVRVPVVMTVHEIARPDANASLAQRAALTLTNRANFFHPALRRLIVHTLPDRERLIALGVAAERIRIIPVGVPPAEPMPAPDEAKRLLGLEGKRVVTLFGFLSAKKGHSLALEALPSLPDDVVLLFAGDRHPDDHTEYVADLRAKIQASLLGDRVHITGFLPDARIPAVMAATDVAIAPFIQSSGSASLAHLFAYGRAVVASDIPPHKEIVSDMPACLSLFRSADAADLAAKIVAVLTDGTQHAGLQAAALSYAERHSYEVMARATLHVYREALG